VTQLTDHFTLEELTWSDTAQVLGIDNTPPPEIEVNLGILAETLELVRSLLNDMPIHVSSGYRCYDLNVAVGGADDSAHLSGLACDFTCPEFGTPLEICVALEPHMESLAIDQLIWEYEGWVHLGLSAGDPRCQCLTINDQGTSEGFA
jgi:zinc D-Ala-D-Ala carboxypeptidase